MNSSIEIADAIVILDKLVRRTGEGKLHWQAVGNGYTTLLGPNLRATVSDDRTFDFSLVEFDPRFATSEQEWEAIALGQSRVQDKEVLNVSVEKQPSYGFDSQGEKQLANLLSDMSALARRSALDLNSSVERALSYLDKIAG